MAQSICDQSNLKKSKVYNITDESYGTVTGKNKNDVLFGGNDKDIFIGHGGNDIFVGNGGKDDYFVDNGDTVKDSDGKGRVFYLLQTFNSQVAHKQKKALKFTKAKTA